MSTLLRSLTLSVILGVVVAGTAFAEDCSGTAEFGVTFGGQDRTVPLRFHSIWAKRPDGAIQFVSGQATGIPAKQ